MDLVYMPEVLPYGGILRPPVVYRDYEQPWNYDYFHLGKSSTTRYQQEQYQQQLRASKEKDHCELCKSNKRRSLAVYIRNKSKTNSWNEIHEEDEEENVDNSTNNVRNVSNTATIVAVSATAPTTITTKDINEIAGTATTHDNQIKPVMKTSRFSFRFKTK